MNSITAPWTAEVVLLSWRSVRNKHRPPLPSELLATFVVFGAIGLVTSSNPKIGSLLGWGIVVSTGINFLGTSDKLIAPGAAIKSTAGVSTSPSANRPRTPNAGAGSGL